MNLFELLFTTKYDSKINSLQSSVEKLITLDYAELISSIIKRIDERVEKYSKEQKQSCERWAKFCWVPMLPNTEKGEGLSKIAPLTSIEADEFMISKLDEKGLTLLLNRLNEDIEKNNLNQKTFDNAVECFEKKQFTACSLCLFALIDSAFITKQKKDHKKRRALANTAIENANNHKEINLAPLKVTYLLVKEIFKNTDDFNIKYDENLYRSMISHGMNTRNPDKKDCLKLFVLLYNILFSFEIGLFSFDVN